jgi:MoaA/NifB/PqqE/SkfB family radical SAM enzyme
MPKSLATLTLDQIAELDIAEKVTFHVMGEPLLHRDFFEILDHASARGLNVGLTTNGGLLRPKTIDALARRDLRQIDISLQSPDEASFHATRGAKADFYKYRENLLDLIEACWQRETHPIFKIRIMVTRFSSKMRSKLGIPDFLGSNAQLHSILTEWTELIYDRINLNGPARKRSLDRIKKINIFGWNVIEIYPNLHMETYLLTDWGNAFADNGVFEVAKGYCFGMRDHFAILYNGDVTLCCVDYDGNTAIGNLNNESLVQILNSDQLARVMEGFSRNRLVDPYCRKCLGSSTRLAAFFKPTISLIGLKLLKPFLYRKIKLYE